MLSSKPPSTEELQALKAELERELYFRGDLSPLMHEGQREIQALVEQNPRGTFVLEIARRWGKTFWLVCLAFSVCLLKPRARVVYGAPTLKHLEEFVLPAIEKICLRLPWELRPVYNQAKGHLTFPNGAYVHLFGADDKRKADRGRGAEADLCIFDEAGFCPLLRYVIRSVFRPQLLHTGGRTILASTPAESPDHDFTAMAERAETNGLYARRTIYDNPRLTEQQIRQFIEDDAKDEGMTPAEYVETDDFRREFLAERVINRLLVVIPEWEKRREELLIDVPRPKYFNGQVTLDFGGNDPHAAHFGYWHFERAEFIVEDELLLRNGENTAELAEAIKAKEKELWGVNCWDGTLRGARDEATQHLLDALPEWLRGLVDKKETHPQPHSRWCDNDIQLARDLYQLHRLAFIPTAKDNLELQVNNLRVAIRQKQFRVATRCVHTDRHLKSTTWKDHKRKDFARKGGEHGDLVATSIYETRNIDRRDPSPKQLSGFATNRPTLVSTNPANQSRLARRLLKA